MRYFALALVFCSLPALAQVAPEQAKKPPSAIKTATPANTFELRHKKCLQEIAKDPDQAYEDALAWQSQGGGRRARHCVAMALFALGHPGEAAFRLEKLAKAPDGGTPAMRADFYDEAAGMWLKADEPHKAYDAATAGLELVKSDTGLRVARAEAYGALGHWDYALIDMNSALAFHPNDAQALRERAKARFKLDKLAEAKADIEKSLKLDDSSVATALLRGRINEALRLVKNGQAPETLETIPERLGDTPAPKPQRPEPFDPLHPAKTGLPDANGH